MDIASITIICPLCRNNGVDVYHSDDRRNYIRCLNCRLVFVPEKYWLNVEDEKAVYDLHRNDPLDQGYRRFLQRLCTPLNERLGAGRHGLDFGCGPGPTLSLMLEAHGHRMDLFDPLYHNNSEVLSKTYDFICATEVVEHLRHPDHIFSALFGMLRKGGWLGIMTKMVLNREAFGKWHYIRDLTHICFFSRNTFDYLADRFDAEIHFVEKDVVLLRR